MAVSLFPAERRKTESSLSSVLKNVNEAGFIAGLFCPAIIKRMMNLIDEEIRKALGSTNPLPVLKRWLKEARQIKFLKEPWVMTLSTGYRGKISSRVLLLKQIHRDKLIFYSNYLSQKGRDIDRNSYSALNFYWPQLNRQIRIEGTVQKTSRRQSIHYWNSRDRTSQISQWISQQSQEVSLPRTA